MHRTLLRHRWLAVWLAAFALFLKVLVPTGFMPAVVDGVMVVELCTGEGLKSVVVDMPQGNGHKTTIHDMPCAFAGLSAPVIGAVDPVLLAAALTFILLAALILPDAPLSTAALRLRPPLRGPPIPGVRS